MAKPLFHLLMKVNHVIVAKFYVANMSFNAIRENKILAKIPEFTVDSPQGYEYATHEIQQDDTITRLSLGLL